MKTFEPNRAYVLDGSDLARIRHVALRLFTENRLQPDEYRDLAQKLEYSVDQALWLEAGTDLKLS